MHVAQLPSDEWVLINTHLGTASTPHPQPRWAASERQPMTGPEALPPPASSSPSLVTLGNAAGLSQLLHKSSQNFQDAHCPLNQCYPPPHFLRVRGGQARPRLVPHPLSLYWSCSPRNPGQIPCHSLVLKHSPPPRIDPVCVHPQDTVLGEYPPSLPSDSASH